VRKKCKVNINVWVNKALIITYESIYFKKLGTRCGLNGELLVPAVLLPGKEHPYPLSRKLG
jgi:hypothetical protein